MRKMCSAPPNSSRHTYWDYYATHDFFPKDWWVHRKWWVEKTLKKFSRIPEDVHMSVVLLNVTGVKVTTVPAFHYNNPTLSNPFLEFKGLNPRWKRPVTLHYLDPTSVYRSYSLLF
eukprot:TRINITY_DN27752_c0_g1_i1.p2 TRINITY_DN27752_c0_g1~~TRINITY_DN27752_c0_g1_i1.p2  ORF type:complete len:116 (-),score=2.09 TRINITY_DN27752_c0_g1_i1:76-423(-)